MLQIIATLAIFLILVIPMGKYMYHIATYQKHLQIRYLIRLIILFINLRYQRRGDGLEKICAHLGDGQCSDGVCRIFDFKNSECIVFKS